MRVGLSLLWAALGCGAALGLPQAGEAAVERGLVRACSVGHSCHLRFLQSRFGVWIVETVNDERVDGSASLTPRHFGRGVTCHEPTVLCQTPRSLTSNGYPFSIALDREA